MSDSEQENSLIAQRRQKLETAREAGEAFPNDFRRDALAQDLHARYDDFDGLDEQGITVEIGRAHV